MGNREPIEQPMVGVQRSLLANDGSSSPLMAEHVLMRAPSHHLFCIFWDRGMQSPAHLSRHLFFSWAIQEEGEEEKTEEQKGEKRLIMTLLAQHKHT